MMRTAVWALGALFLAGIVHIVTVFGIPSRAVVDPWQEIGRLAREEAFTPLPRPAPGVETMPGLDPAMMQAVCRFSLDGSPVRIRAEAADAYWSLSLYDRQGLWTWGVDNRAAEQTPIDILIASNVQVAQLRETLPDELDDVVVVDWAGREGFAIYRILVPTKSQEGSIAAILSSATCKAAPLS